MVTGATARAQDAKAREFQQFAELASMESHTAGFHFDRSAPWRARKLLALKLTDPTLSAAAEEFVKIAAMYNVAVFLRNKSSWTVEDYKKLKEDLKFDEDSDYEVYLGRGLGATLAKVKLLEAAETIALNARARHSRMWTDIMAKVKLAGGSEQEAFPLRIGTLWVRNVSGKAQTNVTLAIKTKSSLNLPADASLHVVFFDRLEADDWHLLPGLLINKLADAKTGNYKPMKDCFQCSVWTDQCRFADVPFDLKAIPPAKKAPGVSQNQYRFGCFPGAAFTGKYNDTTPWTMPPRSAQQLALVDGTWTGTDGATNKPFMLKIIDIQGSRFYAAGGTREAGAPAVFEGTIRDGKIEWEPVVARLGDPDGPSYWGTINGDMMELTYGKNSAKDGTLTLTFKKRKPTVVSIDAKTEADARNLATMRNPGFRIVSVELQPDYTPYGKRWHITMEPN